MNYHTLCQQLSQVYEPSEAKAIARMVYEVRYGLSLSDIYLGRDESVADDDLSEVAGRLLRHEPVQYVLGQNVFMGHTFRCDHRALIPRPETAELCEWALQRDYHHLLDIGTGTGCIAITMALARREAEVDAIDLSADALALAADNARELGATVCFMQRDALMLPDEDEPRYDIIISNPPYICQEEATSMEPNVMDYEPHQALFVPDTDPLLFYRPIARYGHSALMADGNLYFEINPRFADALCRMLTEMGYADVTPRNDAFGKVRFIRATR